MKLRNVLVVSPHPDDEVLGVGGTIPLIKEDGGRVTVVIVTDGSSAQYPGDTVAYERRHREAVEANKLLGTDEVIVWARSNGRPLPVDDGRHHGDRQTGGKHVGAHVDANERPGFVDQVEDLRRFHGIGLSTQGYRRFR